MDDPLHIRPGPFEDPQKEPQEKEQESAPGDDAEPSLQSSPGFISAVAPQWMPPQPGAPGVEEASRKRSLRHNLLLLLSLTLAAFVVTTWILVRVDSPLGSFMNGPQEIVRAQLRALDRGQLRPAYDMFSAVPPAGFFRRMARIDRHALADVSCGGVAHGRAGANGSRRNA